MCHGLFSYDETQENDKPASVQEPFAEYSADLAHNDLIAWKNAVELAVTVYEATSAWPSSESYGMTSQIRRAAVSVAANIAEGQGRGGQREFLRFLYISLGSLREVETLLVVSRRIGLVEDSAFDRVAKACLDTRKPLRGLISHLEQK